MKKIKTGINIVLSQLVFLVSPLASAEDVLSIYKNEIKKSQANFKDFSLEEGKKLYFLERVNSKGNKVSCTLCHSSDPKAEGKTRAGKIIEPLAPSRNPSRFTDYKQVEKWFLRNCRDVLDRECTLNEKGNFITYLKSL